MSDAKFKNMAVAVGEVENTNFSSETGKNGMGKVTLNCDGDKVSVTVWGREDGSTQRFIENLEEGSLQQVQGNVQQRRYDGKWYIDIQAWGTNGFTEKTDTKQKAVASIKGDVLNNEIEFTPEGDPQGELQLLIFDSRGEDKTRAEILQEEIKRSVEWLEENTSKSTDRYKELYESLEDDDSVDNVLSTFEELQKNTDMRFFQIGHLLIKYEDKVGEYLVEESVEEGYNIGLGISIINRMETDHFGEVTGSTQKLLAEKFYEVYERNESESTIDEEEPW